MGEEDIHRMFSKKSENLADYRNETDAVCGKQYDDKRDDSVKQIQKVTLNEFVLPGKNAECNYGTFENKTYGRGKTRIHYFFKPVSKGTDNAQCHNKKVS